MWLIAVGLGWIAGTFATLGLSAGPWVAPLGFLLALPLAFARYGRQGAFLGLAVGGGALLGSLNAMRVDDSAPAWTGLIGQEVIFEGRVETEPDPGFSTVTYLVSVERVVAPQEMGGGRQVAIVEPQYSTLRRHDRVTLRGKLTLPPDFDDFAYRDYLASRGAFGAMLTPQVTVTGEASDWDLQTLASRVRLHMERSLQHALPEPEASLAAGIAFGRDEGLSSETRDDFNRSGLAHLVAVSGGNVSLLVLVFSWLLASRIGKQPTLVLSLLFIVAYVFVAGLSWSIVRAGLMATTAIVGWFIGRPQAGIPALFTALIVITLAAPSAARDPGFQMSFAATAGVIVLAPWITWGVREWLERTPARHVGLGPAVQVAAMSFAAWIATAPLVAYHFERVSFAGLLTNLVAGPLFVLSFIGAWLVIAASVFSTTFAWLVGVAVYYPLSALVWLAAAGSDLPGSALRATRDMNIAVLGCTILLLLAAALYWRLAPASAPTRSLPKTPKVPGYGAIAGGLVVVIWAQWGGATPGTLRIDFLDVRQGDAILVTTPGGVQVLIDGGPSGPELARELGATMRPWDRTLDAIILTHADQDHLAGLPEILDRYTVDSVFTNGRLRDSDLFHLFAGRAATVETFSAGSVRTVDGVRFEVVWPTADLETDSDNEASIVLRVSYGDFSVLLTGDVQGDALATLMRTTDLRATVLKVPHHGSKTTRTDFFAAVSPALAVISVGCENQYGHPAESTMQALEHMDLLRTDVNGRVSVVSDGRSIDVTAERRDASAERAVGAVRCRR